MVGNFYPGARAEWELRVHNGKDTMTSFQIGFRKASYTQEGYFIAPRETQDWIIVADLTPVLAPKETRNILIAVAMPGKLDDATALVYQVMPAGLARINTIRAVKAEEYLAIVKASERYKKEMEIAKAQGGFERIEAEVQGKVQAMLKQFLDTDPEANLLAYFEQKVSVSVKQFSRECYKDTALSGELLKKEFLAAFDLRKDKWEFWISVMDTSQTGMVQAEMASRWLVAMR